VEVVSKVVRVLSVVASVPVEFTTCVTGTPAVFCTTKSMPSFQRGSFHAGAL
jgi:hypothetical protein